MVNNTTYGGFLYAVPASGILTIDQTLQPVKMFPTNKLLYEDVSGSLQLNMNINAFNINNAIDNCGNLLQDSITLTANQIISNLINVQSVGYLANMYINYNNYVNAYFGNTTGFSITFTTNMPGGSYNNGFENSVFTIADAKNLLQDLSGQITINYLTDLLKYVCLEDPFHNRLNYGLYEFTNGFVQGDLIYLKSGLTITLTTHIDNSGIVIYSQNIESFQKIDTSFNSLSITDSSGNSLINYNSAFDTTFNSNPPCYNNTFLEFSINIPVLFIITNPPLQFSPSITDTVTNLIRCYPFDRDMNDYSTGSGVGNLSMVGTGISYISISNTEYQIGTGSLYNSNSSSVNPYLTTTNIPANQNGYTFTFWIYVPSGQGVSSANVFDLRTSTGTILLSYSTVISSNNQYNQNSVYLNFNGISSSGILNSTWYIEPIGFWCFVGIQILPQPDSSGHNFYMYADANSAYGNDNWIPMTEFPSGQTSQIISQGYNISNVYESAGDMTLNFFAPNSTYITAVGGTVGTVTNSMIGYIDDFHYYDGVLTLYDITSIYNWKSPFFLNYTLNSSSINGSKVANISTGTPVYDANIDLSACIPSSDYITFTGTSTTSGITRLNTIVNSSCSFTIVSSFSIASLSASPCLLRLYDSVGGFNAFSIAFSPEGQIYYNAHVFNGNGNNSYTDKWSPGSFICSTNTEYKIVKMVINQNVSGGTLTINTYVNNSFIGTLTKTGDSTSYNFNELNIGYGYNYRDQAASFNGNIYNVKLYNGQIFTSSQIPNL